MQTILSGFRIDALRAPADINRRIGDLAARSLHLAENELLSWRILACSIDSRGGKVQFLYTLLLELPEKYRKRFEAADPELVKKALSPELTLPESSLRHPLVIGTGPCGLFAALALAMAGAEPVILDRGFEVATRFRDYQQFLKNRELNEESNLLIGEGGAGTFSDGKLHTGTKDVRSAFVLHLLAEVSNCPDLVYDKRPHIGSDKLHAAIPLLRQKIIALGGTFRFGSEVIRPMIRNGYCAGVELRSGEKIEAPAVLIAPGLGGRDLVSELRKCGISHSLKSFQIGCRIEHPQALVDDRQYHLHGRSRPAALGAAEYHLVSRPVSSFCMCPGGELLNATAWTGASNTNGMSDRNRSGKFANGCLIVTLEPEKFGDPETAMTFLQTLEKRCFESGGRDYSLPAQDAGAFLAGRSGLSRRESSCHTGIIPGRIDRLCPEELANGLRKALKDFDRLCPGFIAEGVLAGIETGVSSPVRFERNPETQESSLPRLWLGGEGVGAAGGIMSAAIDGLRLAEAMLRQN